VRREIRENRASACCTRPSEFVNLLPNAPSFKVTMSRDFEGLNFVPIERLYEVRAPPIFRMLSDAHARRHLRTNHLLEAAANLQRFLKLKLCSQHLSTDVKLSASKPRYTVSLKLRFS